MKLTDSKKIKITPWGSKLSLQEGIASAKKVENQCYRSDCEQIKQLSVISFYLATLPNHWYQEYD